MTVLRSSHVAMALPRIGPPSSPDATRAQKVKELLDEQFPLWLWAYAERHLTRQAASDVFGAGTTGRAVEIALAAVEETSLRFLVRKRRGRMPPPDPLFVSEKAKAHAKIRDELLARCESLGMTRDQFAQAVGVPRRAQVLFNYQEQLPQSRFDCMFSNHGGPVALTDAEKLVLWGDPAQIQFQIWVTQHRELRQRKLPPLADEPRRLSAEQLVAWTTTGAESCSELESSFSPAPLVALNDSQLKVLAHLTSAATKRQLRAAVSKQSTLAFAVTLGQLYRIAQRELYRRATLTRDAIGSFPVTGRRALCEAAVILGLKSRDEVVTDPEELSENGYVPMRVDPEILSSHQQAYQCLINGASTDPQQASPEIEALSALLGTRDAFDLVVTCAWNGLKLQPQTVSPAASA